MGTSNNRLEILINLIYLARHNMDDPQAVQHYLAEAEKQVMALAAFPPTAGATVGESGEEYTAANGHGKDSGKKISADEIEPCKLHAAFSAEPLGDL